MDLPAWKNYTHGCNIYWCIVIKVLISWYGTGTCKYHNKKSDKFKRLPVPYYDFFIIVVWRIKDILIRIQNPNFFKFPDLKRTEKIIIITNFVHHKKKKKNVLVLVNSYQFLSVPPDFKNWTMPTFIQNYIKKSLKINK